MDREEHKQWFQETVDRFKSLPPEVREVELNHLEMALKDIPAKKKPGPKKGSKWRGINRSMAKSNKAALKSPPTGPGVSPG